MGTYTLEFDGVALGDEVIVPAAAYEVDDPQVLRGFLHQRGQLQDLSPNALWRFTFVVAKQAGSMDALLQWCASINRQLRALGPKTARLKLDGTTKASFIDYHFVRLTVPEPANPAQAGYTWQARAEIMGSADPEFA